MKPAQPPAQSLSTPLLLLAILIFITCVVIGLSACTNPQTDQARQTDTTDTMMETQPATTPPPPIDSMGTDTMNGQPVEQG